MAALPQLSPSSQEIAISLIQGLAKREGITVACTSAPGLQLPEEGLGLWDANLKVEGCSQGTIDEYLRVVRKYLARDQTPTTLRIQQYLAARLGQVSTATVNTERKALVSFFHYLHEEGLWPTNPMERIKAIKVHHKERQVPSTEGIQKLLTVRCYRDVDTLKFLTMLTLLLDTGLRIREACGIRRADINFERREITVLGKGGKERRVPFSPYTAGVLEACLAHSEDSCWLFPWRWDGNGCWNVGCFQKMLRRACEKLGIKPITPHQLRHYFATYSLRAGAKIEVISKILGHSGVDTTMVYRHIDLGEVHQEHAQFGPLNGVVKALPPAGPEV